MIVDISHFISTDSICNMKNVFNKKRIWQQRYDKIICSTLVLLYQNPELV